MESIARKHHKNYSHLEASVYELQEAVKELKGKGKAKAKAKSKSKEKLILKYN